MNRSSQNPVSILLAALLGALCAAPWAQAAVSGGTYRVGAASEVITPPAGAWLAGYGRERAATGVLDDLYAKAIVIDDGNTRIALVTLDSIGLTRPDIVQIEAELSEQLPDFPTGKLWVASTHTHAGPDVVGLWGESMWRSGRDPAYMQALRSSVVQTIIQANADRVAVTSRVVSVELPMDWVVNRSEPGLLDQRLSVMQFFDAFGVSVATLTNYACHPTVLDGENTQVSSDYLAGFYSAMSESLEGEHLFFQGAIGGWVQPIEGDSSHARALKLGTQVAGAAVGALQRSEENPFQPLVMRSKTFEVPLENWGFRLMMWLGVLERETFDGAMLSRASWMRIGNAEFVSHPGETSPAYSFASRELMDTKHSFVLGLTQDAMGYILKPEYFADDVAYPHAEYLQSVSAGPQAGPRLMQALTELINR